MDLGKLRLVRISLTAPFKLYSFADGRTFEPDFLLVLRRKDQDTETILQLFIEPKGTHLIKEDKWKEVFLSQIQPEAKLQTIFQGRDYFVYGLPFFNTADP